MSRTFYFIPNQVAIAQWPSVMGADICYAIKLAIGI
jgi:hypothetical protein